MSAQTNRKYRYSDMVESISDDHWGDDYQRKKFLATFQRERGFPKPRAASKQLVFVDVKFSFFDAIVDGKEVVIHETPWKLPQGAVTLAHDDAAFKVCLLRAFIQGSNIRPLGLTVQNHNCASCGLKANGIVVHTRLWPSQSNKIKYSLFYCCNYAACNMKFNEAIRIAKKKAWKINPALKNLDLCNCWNCQTPEPQGGPKFFRCGACKIPIYCSRECQEQGWDKIHKQQCKLNFRGKLKKEQRKLDGAKLYETTSA